MLGKWLEWGIQETYEIVRNILENIHLEDQEGNSINN